MTTEPLPKLTRNQRRAFAAAAIDLERIANGATLADVAAELERRRIDREDLEAHLAAHDATDPLDGAGVIDVPLELEYRRTGPALLELAIDVAAVALVVLSMVATAIVLVAGMFAGTVWTVGHLLEWARG